MAAQIPTIKLRVGRINQPIRIPTSDLLLDVNTTFLSADIASGSGTLTVKNINGFAINQVLFIGLPGNQGSEIIKTHASTAPTGSTITLASNTLFPHSASTTIYVINFDQVELSTASTPTGSKSVLTTLSMTADDETIFYDTATTGYYFARFKNTITTTFGPYTDAIPVNGYTTLSARVIIDKALKGINKKVGTDLYSDDFAFGELDNCTQEVIRSQKRWSFMQVFDSSLGQLSQGQWRVALPTNIDDTNSIKSIYNFRIGTLSNLTWVDKEKWNEIIAGVAHTTLAQNIALTNTSITLTDSSNFPDSGTVSIGTHTYSYTANNRSTNVLTISASTTTDSSGTDVFNGATSGTPEYWTTFGSYLYFYPILGSTLPSREGILDYYQSVTPFTTDTQSIVFPDPLVAQNYLQWKFLLRQNNGVPDDGSNSARDEYKSRLTLMIQKESMNRTYKLRPTLNQIDLSSNDPKSVRLQGFLP